MTREQFLGSPKIIPTASVALRRLPLLGAARVPFLGIYSAAFRPLMGNVWSTERLIASYEHRRGFTVHEKYRGQGIAQELVYQVIVAAGAPMLSGTYRSEVGQIVCEIVWTRIQKELGAT